MGTPANTGRNATIDYMRCIGMLCVVLAHSGPPAWLLQLRNFDVPLLVAVSAMAYASFPYAKIFPVKTFLVRRAIKLVAPTWLFLTFLFLLMLAVAVILHKPYPYDAATMIGTYSFYKGIGYVWILKIFLAMSLFTPVLFMFDRAVPDNARYFCWTIGAYAIYESVYFIAVSLMEDAAIRTFLEQAVFVIMPFLFVYAYGFRLQRLGTRTIILVMLLSFVVWAVLAIMAYSMTGGFVPTQNFKYPARLYYLSYAMIWINGLYLVLRTARWPDPMHRAAVWISQRSLWIYLWHILMLFIWLEIVKQIAAPLPWTMQFGVVLAGACAIVAVQDAIIRPVLQKMSGAPRRWCEIIFA